MNLGSIGKHVCGLWFGVCGLAFGVCGLNDANEIILTITRKSLV
jgi:hypothetical protein